MRPSTTERIRDVDDLQLAQYAERIEGTRGDVLADERIRQLGTRRGRGTVEDVDGGDRCGERRAADREMELDTPLELADPLACVAGGRRSVGERRPRAPVP